MPEKIGIGWPFYIEVGTLWWVDAAAGEYLWCFSYLFIEDMEYCDPLRKVLGLPGWCSTCLKWIMVFKKAQVAARRKLKLPKHLSDNAAHCAVFFTQTMEDGIRKICRLIYLRQMCFSGCSVERK